MTDYLGKILKFWFNINVRRFMQYCLPSFLKQKVFNIYWLAACFYPLHNLQLEFRNFTIKVRKTAYGNSQFLVMSENLNDVFDPVQRRISIQCLTLNNAVALENQFSVYIPNFLPYENGTEDNIRNYIKQFVLTDALFNIEIV